MWLWRYTINTISLKKKKKEERDTFSVQIFANEFLQLWELNPSQANHSTGCNCLLFIINEYKLVMIPGPVVTCIIGVFTHHHVVQNTLMQLWLQHFLTMEKLPLTLETQFKLHLHSWHILQQKNHISTGFLFRWKPFYWSSSLSFMVLLPALPPILRAVYRYI